MNNVDFEEDSPLASSIIMRKNNRSNDSFFVRLMIRLHFARNRSQAMSVAVMMVFFLFFLASVIWINTVGVGKKKTTLLEKYENYKKTQSLMQKTTPLP